MKCDTITATATASNFMPVEFTNFNEDDRVMVVFQMHEKMDNYARI
jgi:hypothetical protein